MGVIGGTSHGERIGRDGHNENAHLFERFIVGEHQSIIEVFIPEVEQGKKILLEKDNIWYYLPDVLRGIRVSPGSIAMGSSSSYPDMTAMDLLESYRITDSTVVTEDNNGYCFVELEGTKSRTYDRIEYPIDRRDLYSVIQGL